MTTMSSGQYMLRRRLTILAVAIAGLAASVGIFLALQQRQIKLVEAQFDLAAEERLAAIDRELQRNLDAVVDLAAFYGASKHVDREEFRLFTARSLSRHASIRALQWAPRIEPAGRSEFERDLAETLAEERPIREFGPDGALVAAGARDRYFPVCYAEPAGENHPVFGFDHASDPHRWQAIEQARDLGTPVASKQRSDRGEARDRAGILVFMPIYRNGAPTDTVGDRRGNLAGVCIGVLELGAIVDTAIEHLGPAEIEIVVAALDPTGVEAVYVHGPRAEEGTGAFTDAGRGMHWDHDVELANRRYRLRCRPTAAFLESHTSWTPLGAGLVGLLMSALFLAYLLQLSNEASRTQRLVDERTASLRVANEHLAIEVGERSRSEEALRRSEQRFELAVRGSSDGLWDWDMTTGYVYYAPRFKEMLGYAGDEFPDVFESFESHLHPEDHDRVLAAVQDHVERRVPYDVEYQLRTKSGEYRWFRARGQAVWEPDGTVTRMAGSVTDITERRAMGDELRLAVGSLELQNTELRSLQESLQEALSDLGRSNQELDDFAYIASHDLKEPLRGIHNYSSFLLEDYEDRLDEDGQAKLRTLVKLTQRMETLIDSLLHFSRVGRTDLAVAEVDLDEVVSDIIESLQFSLQEKGVEVRIPRPLPVAVVDVARVGEVFRNLITNASKYNDKAEPWIEIGWIGPGDGEVGGDVGLSGVTVYYVRDNGIGIPEKHRDSIFRIFKRLHGRDKFGGGTGAGLTIVKKIVERHGGLIWLDSAPGEGTTFYFTLEEEHAVAEINADRSPAHSAG